MATISSTLALDDRMSQPSNAIASALQKASDAADIAAANTEVYQSKLDEISAAMDENEAALGRLEQAQAATYSASRQSEIERIISKQNKLNDTYQKTEIALMKSNTTYTQQKNKVEELNKKLSETGQENEKIKKQADTMKSPFEKWAVKVTGLNSALRLTTRIMRTVSNALKSVLEATDEWEGINRKTDNSIKAVQKSIGERLIPLAAVFSSVYVSAFEWIGQKANDAVSWVLDNIDLIANALAVIIVVAGAIAIGFAIANIQVILIIGAILAVSSALTDFGLNAEDILSTVGGIFGWLYGVVYNIFVDLWNFIGAFVEFFANVWNDPLGSVQRLFIGVFDSILGIIETVAGAIGRLLGQDWTSGIAGLRAEMQAFAEGTYKEDAFRFERMAYVDEQVTMKAGAEFGRNMGKALDGIGDKLDNFDLKKYSTGNALNIKSEDIRMMLDMATAAYQVQYQQITPQIVLEGTIIRESADMDRVMDVVAERVYEMASVDLTVAVL